MRRGQRPGQALVEFALVTPLFLVLFGGLIQIGLLFHRQILITDTAREGARLAALGWDETRIRTRLAAPLGATATLTLEVGSDSVTVTVRDRCNLTLVPGLSGLPLTADTTMRIE